MNKYLNRKLYTLDEVWEEIKEFNINDLKDEDGDNTISHKEHNMASHYNGVLQNGTIMFKTTAVTTGDIEYWYQRVKLLDLDEAIEVAEDDDSMEDKDIVNLALFGDLAVYCDDPSFLYWGWQYISWNMDYGLEKETREPDIRNPQREGTICKHLYNVLTVLPTHIFTVAKDMRGKGIL